MDGRDEVGVDGRDEVGCGWEGEGGRSEVGWGCGTCVEGEGCLHLVAIAIIFSTHTHTTYRLKLANTVHL